MISILQELQISSIDKLKNEKFIKEKLDGRNPELISKMLLMMYSMDKEIKELTARIDKYERSDPALGVERLSNEVETENNNSHLNVKNANSTDHSNDTDTDNDYATDNNNDTDDCADNDTDDYINNESDNSNDIGDIDSDDDGVSIDIVNDINIDNRVDNDIGHNIGNDVSNHISNDGGNDTNIDIGNDIKNVISGDIGKDIVSDVGKDIVSDSDINNDIGKDTNNGVNSDINNENGKIISKDIGKDNDKFTNNNKLKISNNKNTYIFNDDENKIVKRLSWPPGAHVFKTPISFSEKFCSTMNENIKKNGKPWPEISLSQLAIKFKIPKDILARTSRNLNAYNKLNTSHYNSNNSKSGTLKQPKQVENRRNIKRKELIVPKIENKNANDIKNNKNPVKKRPKKLRITRSRIQRNRSTTNDVESSSESVSDPNAPSSSEDDDDNDDDDDDDGKQPPYARGNGELKNNEINSNTSELSTKQSARILRNSAKRSLEDNEEKSIKIIKKTKNCRIKQENKIIDVPINQETKSNDLKAKNHLSMAELLNHTNVKLENSDISNDSVLNNKKTDDSYKMGPAYISQTHILSDQSTHPVSSGSQPEFKYTVTEKGFFKCDTCVADPQIFLQYIDLYRHKQLQHPEEFPKYAIH